MAIQFVVNDNPRRNVKRFLKENIGIILTLAFMLFIPTITFIAMAQPDEVQNTKVMVITEDPVNEETLDESENEWPAVPPGADPPSYDEPQLPVPESQQDVPPPPLTHPPSECEDAPAFCDF